jgi:predicted dehydrogenase
VPAKWEKSWQVISERMTGQFTGWNSAVLTHTQGDATKIERIETQTDVFVAQLADLAEAISRGRAPRVSLEDGAKTLRIALTAARSIAEKREIRL